MCILREPVQCQDFRVYIFIYLLITYNLFISTWRVHILRRKQSPVNNFLFQAKDYHSWFIKEKPCVYCVQPITKVAKSTSSFDVDVNFRKEKNKLLKI